MIKVDSGLCDGCGACKDTCPVEGVGVVNGKAAANEQCIDCGACIGACPKQAITAG